MSSKTSIEWTRGDDGVAGATWNPVRGCTKVSAGCKNCYAERFAERFRGVPGHPFEQGFDVRLVPEALDLPLHWKKPRRVFVNSMSDLFHEAVPDEFIARVFEVMAYAGRHTFQILTKRPERLESALVEVPSNVWIGVSVEDQAAADKRIPLLLAALGRHKFLSCEPLLGLVDLQPTIDAWARAVVTGSWVPGRIGWVIVGGESGPGARPMRLAWAGNIVAQCQAAGVPVFVKQLGAVWARECKSADRKGGDVTLWPPSLRVRQFPEVAP